MAAGLGGFDIGLVCCFAAATWLGLRRRRAAVPLLAATAALLCSDAWFDVVLDWTQPDRRTSVVMAVLMELPIAALLLLRAKLLIIGDMPTRLLTVQDIQVHTDTSYQRLLRTLGNLAPATAETVAAALGLGGVEVTAALSRLARVGYVRQWRDGRWRRRAQNLRLPKIDQIDNADRPRVAAYLNAKYDLELRLLTWAARHRDEFGPWGKGERAVTHLTETELSSLDAEYNELITRYCLLRTGPTRDTREVAVRFYAFPFHPVDEASEESRATPYPEPAG